MARDEAPPFARGETYYNGSVKDPIFSDPLNLCGKEYVFEPNSPDGQNEGDPSGRAVRVRIAQNVSTIPLLPSRFARFKIEDPGETACDGYFFQTSDQIAGVVDDELPAAGVPIGDFFYLILDGPTVVTSITSSFVALAAGDRIEVQTGSSTTDATAGLISKYASSPTTTDLALKVGRVEDALSAAGLVNAIVHIPRV